MPLQVPPGDWVLEMLRTPTQEPLSLAQAKAHLRVQDDLTDFDQLIADYTAAARNYIEETYGLPIMPQKVRLSLSQFPRMDRIRLPIWPVQSVDAARYYPVTGPPVSLTVGDYASPPTPDLLFRHWRKPCEIVLPWAHIWPPVVLQMADAVQFDLTVGFDPLGSPSVRPIPQAIFQALRLLIGHFYDIGAAVTVIGRPSEPLVLGVDAMLANVRLYA